MIGSFKPNIRQEWNEHRFKSEIIEQKNSQSVQRVVLIYLEDIRIHFGADDSKRVGVKLIFLGDIGMNVGADDSKRVGVKLIFLRDTRINVEQMILKGLELK